MQIKLNNMIKSSPLKHKKGNIDAHKVSGGYFGESKYHEKNPEDVEEDVLVKEDKQIPLLPGEIEKGEEFIKSSADNIKKGVDVVKESFDSCIFSMRNSLSVIVSSRG